MDAIKRMKFWIVLGLLVVASGVVVGVWFVPARKTSATSLSDWNGKAAKVQTYAEKPVRSSYDVQDLGALQAGYERQFKDAMQLLENWDKLLEDFIPGADNSRRALDGGDWKLVYSARMDDLEGFVQASFPSAPDGVVVRTDFGASWPTEDQMKLEAKRYWVQRYLLEAIAQANSVNVVIPTLKAFSPFGRPDRLLSADDATMFSPIAFEFYLATEFENVPVVLRKLFDCQVPVSVTSVSAKRRPKVSLAVQKKTETSGSVLSATAVDALLAASRVTRGPMMTTFEGPPWAGGGPPPWEMSYVHGPTEEISTRAARSTGGRFTRAEPTRTTRRTTTAAPVVKRTAEEVEAGRVLVDVTVKGYVRDYVPPAEPELADAAKQ